MTLTRLPSAIVAFALVIVLALTAPIPGVGAQDDRPDPEQTSAAVPFIGEYEVWCTESNPGAMGLCQRTGHHSTPAIDFGMPVGTTLRATGSGVVIEADAFCSGRGSCNNGAGNIVVIEHPDGRFSRYLHMDTVAVSVGQTVNVGAVLGTNGLTGHNSSAHLHFDEQFPLGTRVNAGTMLGCVNGAQVEYPSAFGVSEWHQVPFGSIMINDGYDCLSNGGAASPSLVDTAKPRIFAGPDKFAVAPPLGDSDALYEVVLFHQAATEPVVFRLAGDTLRTFSGIDGVSEIRARLIIDGVAQRWSDMTQYDASHARDGDTCNGLFATQQSLTGTAQADVIIGTDGNDVINGLGGRDFLCGGPGADAISGGNGADKIFGGSGADVINGGRGQDTIFGRSGADQLFGGRGKDSIFGGRGADTISGQRGNDKVQGNSGTDVVRGGGHDDTVLGGLGADTLDGGVGQDRCVTDDADTAPATNCES